jgi:hypothetical protein
MYGIQLLNSFDFYDDAIGDYQVEAIATIESNSPVDDRQRLLLFNTEATLAKFVDQAGLIG